MQSIDTTCSICTGAAENEVHLFFNYDFAASIWFGCPLGIINEFWSNYSLLERIARALERPTRHAFSPLEWSSWAVTILDQIWIAPNLLINEDITPNPSFSIDMCISRSNEIIQVVFVESRPTDNNPIHSWGPPHLGSIKINVDAAVGIQSIAIGIIARNHEGGVFGSASVQGPLSLYKGGGDSKGL